MWARRIIRRGPHFLVECMRVPSGERFTTHFSQDSVKYLPNSLKEAIKERFDV